MKKKITKYARKKAKKLQVFKLLRMRYESAKTSRDFFAKLTKQLRAEMKQTKP
jgi:hypothetical protein